MTSQIEQFRTHFDNIVEQVQKFVIFVRGREFQEDSIIKLDGLLTECITNKEKAISSGAENEANAFLAYELIARAFIEEFKFVLALKNDDPDSAWDHLVYAQQYVAEAMRSHNVASYLSVYAQRLDVLEKMLFPLIPFISTSFIVNESKCSICGMEYGECDHLKGLAYQGKLCVREVTDATLREISFVSNPASKHCRVINIGDDKEWRNIFTYRVVKKDIK